MTMNNFDKNKLDIFHLVYPLIIMVFIFCCVIPFITSRFSTHKQEAEENDCKQNEILISLRTNYNSWIHVVPEQDINQDILIPYISKEALIYLVNDSPYHNSRSFTDISKHANPGNSFSFIPYYYIEDSDEPLFKGVWFVINTSELPENTGVINVCGKEVTTELQGKPYVRTFIDTNLNSLCSTCGTRRYNPKISNMSSILFLTIMISIITDSSAQIIKKLISSRK